MKKTKIKILILAASLSIGATSCQKDTITESASENVSIADNCQFHLTYFVNENPTTANLPNSAALHQLIQELDILAIEGYSISIRNPNYSSSDLPTKDVVKIETKDKEEFDKWLEKMVSDGYEVYWGFDKETGTFIGIATKK